MLNFRRAPQDLSNTSAPTADEGWPQGYDDPALQDPRHLDIDFDRLADTLAAEFDAIHRGVPSDVDPMDPVDIETGNVHHSARQGYDPWDDEALDQLAAELSQYDDFDPQTLGQGVLPPHPHAEEEAAPHGSGGISRTALALGAVGVVVLGGVGWALFGPSGLPGFGEPVIVAAPTEPYKIVPEAGDTIDEPIEGTVSFDPVTGLPPKGEERLVAREEEIPDLPGVTPQVNRVILPDGQEIVEEEPVSPAEAGPRRVRTVLVRPDGSIIESPDRSAAPAPTPTDPELATEPSPIAEAIAAAEGQPSSAGLPPIPETDQVEAAVDDPVAALLPPLPDEPVAGTPVTVVPPAGTAPAETAPVAVAPPIPQDAPAASAPPVEPPAEIASTLPDLPGPAEPSISANPSEAVTPVPETPVAEPAATAVPEPAVVDAPMPRVRPAPPPAAPEPVEQTQVAAIPEAPAAVPPAETTAPAQAEPAAPAAAGAAAYVQVSSQRSEAAALASFQDLQRRFPNILGGLTPDVQRADLGAKGVYYRVRVPQPSRDAANGLCASLKSMGADCLIARR
jgi:hypothetical protein